MQPSMSPMTASPIAARRLTAVAMPTLINLGSSRAGLQMARARPHHTPHVANAAQASPGHAGGSDVADFLDALARHVADHHRAGSGPDGNLRRAATGCALNGRPASVSTAIVKRPKASKS